MHIEFKHLNVLYQKIKDVINYDLIVRTCIICKKFVTVYLKTFKSLLHQYKTYNTLVILNLYFTSI